MTFSRAKVRTVYSVTCPLCGFIRAFEHLSAANTFAATHDCQSYRNGWNTIPEQEVSNGNSI